VTVRHIKQALEMAGGKINGPGGAAQILELHPNTLRNRMKKLGIPYGRRSWQP
jgi:transcriptional regulator with GAF, ATPase, and Fis domain